MIDGVRFGWGAAVLGGSARRVLMCGAAAAALIAAGPRAQAETFADALVMALEVNPAYDAAVASLQGLDETVALARAGMRPSVSGDVRLGGSVSSVESSVTDGRVTAPAASATLSVTQSLYDGGQTANATEEALANVRAGRAALIGTEQTVLLEAVVAYVDVSRTAENVVLSENNVRVISRELDAAQDRFEVGEVTRTDVAQAKARLAESRAALSTARGVHGSARQAYLRAIGKLPEDLAPLPPLPELPASLEEAQAIAEKTHPSILSAQAAIAAASSNVREEVGGTLPSLDFVGSLSSSYADIGSNGFNTSSDAVTASGEFRATIPLYAGGGLRAEVRRAQALASQERAELFDATRLILEDVGQAWENLQSAQATIVSNRESITANEIAFEGVQEEAKVGSRTTLDVLDAETALLNSRVALVDSLGDEYVAAYQLLSAMGLLTASHLGLDVIVYDPEPNLARAQEFGAGYEDTADTEWLRSYQP